MKISQTLVAHTFLFRMLPASGGALLGSLLTLIFFIMIQFAAQSVGEGTAVISGFLLFSITFLAALFSNVFATIFLALSSKENFKGKFSAAITQIFYVNTGIMVASSPLFLILSQESGYFLTKFFLPFSALSSVLLFEAFANPSNSLLAAHKVIVSGMVIAFLFFLFFPRIIPNEMMAFFLLPIVWLIIPIASFAVEQFHLSFFRK